MAANSQSQRPTQNAAEPKKDGTFQKVGKAIQRPSFRDAQIDGTVFWYRVATINLAGEGPQSDPVCAAAATCTVKRVISQDKIGVDGHDLTTRGNWQGVYGREAAYLAKDHGKKTRQQRPVVICRPLSDR